jgi:hypothetical protein
VAVQRRITLPNNVSHPPAASWSRRYGQRHQLQRVEQFPLGITPPRKVRIYWRCDHWVLQWWEPSARQNLSQRIQGDLIAAISAAREIDQRLLECKSSGLVSRKLRHQQLVEKFLADLAARADAGQLQPRSTVRYTSALRHYLAFAEQPKISGKYPFAGNVDREFALAFGAFLAGRYVSPNGLAGTTTRLMKGAEFVWDAVRSMFQWAGDPDRGRVLAEHFRNPFLRRCGDRRRQEMDPFGDPDITVTMAAEFLGLCDAFQLRLFVPMIFYGLRAAEPCYLFWEYVDDAWLRVPCSPELNYTTKGKRDKRLPLVEPVRSVLLAQKQQQGLLLLRRAVVEQREKPPLLGSSLRELASELEKRCRSEQRASLRQKLRDALLWEAGGINYDQIDEEFRSIARQLRWPASATLKDFRHLFASSLTNAGMVEAYRQYLMGHATSSAAISAYTHLGKIGEHYQLVVEKEWSELTHAIEKVHGGRAGVLKVA